MSQPRILSPAELQSAITSKEVACLDVRLADDHAAQRIPGSTNNCVFEVSFVSRLEEAFPDHGAAICVYGAAEDSAESRMAVEKMKRAGYEQVLELREGLEGWIEAGFEAEGSSEVPRTPSAEGTYPIHLEESRVEWTGRNLLNKHWGTLGLKAGKLDFDDGKLVGGVFTFDMRDMKCADLDGHELHDVLIHHLQSDDFFDVERFPEAELAIHSAEQIPNRAIGAPNLRLHCQLTLCGETHPISIDATAGYTDEGKPAAQAAFAIDRTRWNVIYGSGKFFKRLAGHLVNDMVELQVRVVAA